MALTDRLDSLTDGLARRFASLTGTDQNAGTRWGALTNDSGQGTRWTDLITPSGGGSRWGTLAQEDATARYLGNSGGGAFGLPLLSSAFNTFQNEQATRKAKEAAASGQYNDPTRGGVAETGGAGLALNVARWEAQTKQTFGDIMDPDIMLAIMTNESGGDPNAYNAAGDAWGLFQNVGLGSKDPNVQFTAARKLVEQKLASIAQSYAANGLNPDERTRARDVALAWAGHFDYATGRPNPASRDIGSGQTADQLSTIFLANYDRIKAARQTAQTVPTATPNGTGYVFPVAGFKGSIALHHGASGNAADLFADRGTAVLAMRNGTVIDASYNQLGGNTVTLRGDDGLIVYYAHLDQPASVRTGQQVVIGQQVGVVGDSGNAQGTGTHLHIGIGKDIQSGAGPEGGAGIPWGPGTYQNTNGLLSWILGFR